jgi:hypothetical protein
MRLFLLSSFMVTTAFAQVTDVTSLVAAVNGGVAGATVQIAAGTYALTAPLQPKAGMTLIGAGAGQTTITAAASWSPGLTGLPDNSVDQSTVIRTAYLIDLGNDAVDVTISDLTLTAAQHHGAIYGNNCDRLHLHHLHLESFLWSGVRTFRMDGGKIHDCTFLDAGGRSGGTTGQNGGAVFVTFVKTSEFWNNRITKSAGNSGNFFGFKGRQATDCRIHHNTVGVSFSVEFPFENDRNVEIDHNDFSGGISIPKFGGATVVPPANGFGFRIHHNWMKRSYSLEWARNSAEVDHNFFDFTTADDTGNLVSNFGSEAAPGPTFFHDNLIRNPGRGIFWSTGIYNGLTFANNHVRANTLTRTEGFFGFNTGNDFATTIIRDNIIEGIAANPRPLMRNAASYAAVIENNQFTHINDTASYANTATAAPRGPTTPLHFEVGVQGESVVDGWNTYANSYAAWQAAFDWGGIPPSERDPLDDPDGDGRINFLEFFAQSRPTAADAAPLLEVRRLAGGQLALSFPERTGGIHPLTVEVEQSGNLTNWLPATGITVRSHDTATGRSEVTLSSPAANLGFYRIRVSEPPP